MLCCCKYLDKQTSCPSRQALSDRERESPSDAEVCGGGESIHPHTNAAYLRLPLSGTDCMCTGQSQLTFCMQHVITYIQTNVQWTIFDPAWATEILHHIPTYFKSHISQSHKSFKQPPKTAVETSEIITLVSCFCVMLE